MSRIAVNKREMLFSVEGKNYYIVLTDKEYDRDKIVGRRITTLDDINGQAEFIWSLFNRKERARYRVLVQGELTSEDEFFDSDKLC